MIPMSRIQVCNHLLPGASDNPSIPTPASCPLPAATSGGLYPPHAMDQAADPDHNVHIRLSPQQFPYMLLWIQLLLHT